MYHWKEPKPPGSTVVLHSKIKRKFFRNVRPVSIYRALRRTDRSTRSAADERDGVSGQS
jgi:hypothetical protein